MILKTLICSLAACLVSTPAILCAQQNLQQQGGFGQNASGGGTGGPALNQNAGTGTVNTNFGNGFVGRSDNAGRFVGNQFAGPQNQNGGGSSRNIGGSQNQFGNVNTNSGRNTNQPTIRYRQKIAFDYPVLGANGIRTSLASRMQHFSKRKPEFADLQVTVQDTGDVLLQGTVPTEADSKLVAHLIRMEPGVRKVKNELNFGNPNSTPEPGTPLNLPPLK